MSGTIFFDVIDDFKSDIRIYKIPVIGLGGIASGRDAMEFILAGASAVQVGTANFIYPNITLEIINYIKEYCARHNVKDITELIGAVNK